MKCDKCKHDLSAGKSRCTKCGHWNHASAKSHDGELLSNVKSATLETLKSGGPWDPVFSSGGGIVKITSNFLAGPPGAGKSSILLQLASAVSIREKRPVLYISKEEAKEEISARALRLELDASNIMVVKVFSGSTRELLESIKPSMTILDSLQGLVGLGPGHLDEAAEVLTDLKDYAEAEKSPALVISHVTKEHDFAGEMALQHLVTATFMLESDKRDDNHRILRARKNRHGDVSLRIHFDMTEKGLILKQLPDSTELDKKVEESSKTSVYSSRKRTP